MSVTDLAGTVLDYVLTFIENNWLFVAVVALALTQRRRPAATVSIPDKPWLHSALIVTVSLVWFLGAAAIHGLPLPHVHDEHSYLTAADMFAHGHVAHAEYPVSKHFE